MTGRLFIGVDLGGTKLLSLVAREDGTILGRDRRPTEAAAGPEAVVRRIAESARAAAAAAGVDMEQIAGIGVSAPGPIDAETGVVTTPPNLPGWKNVPLARLLAEDLGRPALLENDANAAAYGEFRHGAARGCRHILFVTVSTGIGGGLILDGRLYRGASGGAGEVGHMAMVEDGRRCGAGHPGCLEALASGTAIARQAEEAIAAGRLPRTAALSVAAPPLQAETVFEAATSGEAEARAIIESAGRWFGLGLATMTNVFNPQVIVLGGGLLRMGEMYLGPARASMRERTFAQAYQDVRIVEGELGEAAEALGAIALLAERRAAG